MSNATTIVIAHRFAYASAHGLLLVDVVHRGAEPSAHHDVQRPQADWAVKL